MAPLREAKCAAASGEPYGSRGRARSRLRASIRSCSRPDVRFARIRDFVIDCGLQVGGDLDLCATLEKGDTWATDVFGRRIEQDVEVVRRTRAVVVADGVTTDDQVANVNVAECRQEIDEVQREVRPVLPVCWPWLQPGTLARRARPRLRRAERRQVVVGDVVRHRRADTKAGRVIEREVDARIDAAPRLFV